MPVVDAPGAGWSMARALPATAVALLLLAACSSSDTSRGAATFPPTVPSTGAPAGSAAPGDAAATTAPAATGTPTSGTSGTPAAPDLSKVAVKLTEIGRFDQPIAIVERDGVFYVAEQDGRILATDGDGSAAHEVLDMTDRTKASGEQGLLDLAFSPEGSHLYVSYTNNDGDSRIDEYATTGDGVDPSTRREVLAIDQPYANHNGGGILFGPDGLLYAGYGDGGSAGDPKRNGQNPDTLLAKLLRIDPTPNGDAAYTIPPDNPYASGGGARPEIWSSGLRNPWRFSFDAATGDLWIGDVGQNAIEEIDHVPAADGAGRGTNFGWSAYEGSARYNKDQDAPGSWMPVYEYHHGNDGCSVTGGSVYRGEAVPDLQGAYLYSDYCAGGVRALVAVGDQVTDRAVLSDEPGAVVSFGTDAKGELYVVSQRGSIYRLDPA
jgi:glucose/arabinose dehydrogenase